MIIFINGLRSIFIFCFPFFPGSFYFRSHLLGTSFKTILQRKLICAFSDQHNVGGFFHYHSCHRNRVEDMLQKSYRTCVPFFIHYGCIKGYMPVHGSG